MAEKRGYGIGLQVFEDFIRREAIYVDKTAYVYKMAHTKAKNFFLSRPRRFGKSLLVSTLEAGLGADVHAEEQTSDGRMDISLKVADAIYILEFKYGKTAVEARDQILQKNYAVRFAADPRPVFAVGLNISKGLEFMQLDIWEKTPVIDVLSDAFFHLCHLLLMVNDALPPFLVRHFGYPEEIEEHGNDHIILLGT